MSFAIRREEVLRLMLEVIYPRFAFWGPRILITSRHSYKEIITGQIVRSLLRMTVDYVCASLLSSYAGTSSLGSVPEPAKPSARVLRIR